MDNVKSPSDVQDITGFIPSFALQRTWIRLWDVQGENPSLYNVIAQRYQKLVNEELEKASRLKKIPACSL